MRALIELGADPCISMQAIVGGSASDLVEWTGQWVPGVPLLPVLEYIQWAKMHVRADTESQRLSEISSLETIYDVLHAAVLKRKVEASVE